MRPPGRQNTEESPLKFTPTRLLRGCRTMLMVALFLIGFIFEFLVELPFRVILALGAWRRPGA
jgi:hypothetical protein